MKESLAMPRPRSIDGLPARIALSLLSRPERWFACALAPAWALAFFTAFTPAHAQTPTATAPAAPAGGPASPTHAATPAATVNPPSTLEAFGWLHGCWDGKVNQRDFHEQWLPMRGDMMIGVSQTVSQGKTVDYEYLRLELRPEGMFYVAVPSGAKETSFRFSGKTIDGGSEIFTFDNPADEFPQRIIYRRGTEGWLYAHVEGRLNGQPRSVIYPMRRVDCASGALISQGAP